MTVARRGVAWCLFSSVLLVASCSDQGPDSGPGPLIATLQSPNGVEGAAVVRLVGEGLGEVSPLSGRVFSQLDGDTLTVVVVNLAGGDLAFSVSVADTARKPVATVVEVAGTDDALRGSLAGYELDIRR